MMLSCPFQLNGKQLGVLVQLGDTSSVLQVTSISTLVYNYLLNIQMITFISHDLYYLCFLLFCLTSLLLPLVFILL